MTQENPNPQAVRPAKVRTFAGVRASAILEIILFLAVCLAVDHLFLDGTRFRNASLHPFWIPVLLVAAQYGTNGGVFAALCATAALLLGNLPAETISQDRFGWWLEVAKLPLSWFVSAVILGELRIRQIRERSLLQEQLAETARREQVVTAAYKRVMGLKEALETRLAGQMKTAVGLYESARAIETLNPSQVLMGIAGLVRSAANPEKFSAYLLQNGRLELSVREGSDESDVQRTYGPESQLFVEIVGRQRMLCAANSEDAALLAGEGVVAVPIVVPDGGRVVGMLKIEKMGFLDLTFSNLQMLRIVCQWVGAAYDNALRYETARAEGVVNTETELLAYGFLSRQLSFLSILAARIGFDLTMVVVRLQNVAELPPVQRVAAPRAFSRAAAQALRKTDLAFDYQRTGSEFALILPASTPEHGDVVVGKLRAALARETSAECPDAQFSFAVHAIHQVTQRAANTPQGLLEIVRAIESGIENNSESNHEVPRSA